MTRDLVHVVNFEEGSTSKREEATLAVPPPRTAIPPSAACVVSIRDVRFAFEGSKKRGTVTVLAGVDFEVAEREFVAVMGPSGCGKSTLLNMMAGFQTPTSGELLYRGEPIARPGAERGLVFQSPALYPWMTVLENVLFGPKATGRRVGAHDRARQLLEEVGLEGFEHHRPYELSGGMQHRVALVRTLVNEPDVLLMDEPFAALDAQTRSEMQALLLAVWERHRSSVVFVTHDIEEGLLLADRVVVLTRRPARVREIVTVQMPRPRTYELVLTPEFVELRGYVRSLMRVERT
jgi:NitT/TauT family transport system ATP-binding protein